jgi:hypothetical protein
MGPRARPNKISIPYQEVTINKQIIEEKGVES